MSFPENIKEQALKNADNKCEKCKTPVTMKTSHAHHKLSVKSGGADTLSNCQILCKPCHVNTTDYGKS
jgi:5-methylcytosine-specific restriction endonuclease McrA